MTQRTNQFACMVEISKIIFIRFLFAGFWMVFIYLLTVPFLFVYISPVASLEFIILTMSGVVVWILRRELGDKYSNTSVPNKLFNLPISNTSLVLATFGFGMLLVNIIPFYVFLFIRLGAHIYLPVISTILLNIGASLFVFSSMCHKAILPDPAEFNS